VNTTPPDEAADVDAAAERLKRMDAGEPITSVYGFVEGTVDDMAAHWNDDRIRTSEAYLALTDPTPLAVEALVGMGGNREGETIHWNGFEILAPFLESTTWRWWYHGSRQHHPPRTVGELRQLLRRLEER